MRRLKILKEYKGYLLLLICALIFIITFETAQQLFYVTTFNINQNVTFLDLLKNQAFRWLIWFLLSGFIFWYLHKKKDDNILSLRKVISYSGLILCLVVVNILIISISMVISNNDVFTFEKFVYEYLQFFLYQKSAMYILGYVAITVIVYLYLVNERLHIKVHNLSELRLTNERLYLELKNKLDDKTSVLNIKIGNKRKIIATKDILWIEADDYCVKVHTISNGSYTMRSSLKALDQKLSTQFLRVHRKALVNMTFAKELHVFNPPSLILENDLEVPVSQNNLKTVKDFLN